MQKVYNERSELGPCLLRKADLTHVADLLEEAMPKDHGVEVIAEFENIRGS